MSPTPESLAKWGEAEAPDGEQLKHRTEKAEG